MLVFTRPLEHVLRVTLDPEKSELPLASVIVPDFKWQRALLLLYVYPVQALLAQHRSPHNLGPYPLPARASPEIVSKSVPLNKVLVFMGSLEHV